MKIPTRGWDGLVGICRPNLGRERSFKFGKVGVDPFLEPDGKIETEKQDSGGCECVTKERCRLMLGPLIACFPPFDNTGDEIIPLSGWISDSYLSCVHMQPQLFHPPGSRRGKTPRIGLE